MAAVTILSNGSWATTGSNNNPQFTRVCRAISEAITAVGITKTTDVGQTDFTTATNGTYVRPGAANTFPYFEIRQFTDALSSSYPVYMKMEYGNYQFGAFCMRITTGIATDGSGSLNSVNFSAGGTYGLSGSIGYSGSYSVPTSGSAYLGAFDVVAANNPSYFSSDGGRLTMLLFNFPIINVAAPLTTRTAGFWAIERTRDAAGAYTSDGVNILRYDVGFQGFGYRVRAMQYLPLNGGQPYPNNILATSGVQNWANNTPSSNQSNGYAGVLGGYLNVRYIYPTRFATLQGPHTGAVLFGSLDLQSSGNFIIRVPQYGQLVTYVIKSPDANDSQANASGLNSGFPCYWAVAVRWD